MPLQVCCWGSTYKSRANHTWYYLGAISTSLSIVLVPFKDPKLIQRYNLLRITALCNVHFNFKVSEISLCLRIALISIIYKIIDSVSMADLSRSAKKMRISEFIYNFNHGTFDVETMNRMLKYLDDLFVYFWITRNIYIFVTSVSLVSDFLPRANPCALLTLHVICFSLSPRNVTPANICILKTEKSLHTSYSPQYINPIIGMYSSVLLPPC